ncbi:hypothetical protein NUW58_g8996 [Xylaria curta]|uniref:Uncharacterized protein n=1 Tax=Xylaria curta TaxID=42375 RepID=A0ACC1N2R6_9PEZI|nr:hypothetical protein NUW58_g8996 [Xylaria curta]
MGNGRKSPGPSPDQVRQDTALYNLDMEAVEEAGVGKYFLTTIFPDPIQSDSIQRIERQPMAKHTIPSTARSEFKISSPIPDALYGYNRNTAFTQQFTQLISMKNDPMANARGMIYPFFVIEFKGATGNLWVATNQCVGGSVSCVNMIERLNEQLRKCKSDNIQAIDSAVFSIAMNATEARLFISWKHNKLDYYMQQVECFALQRPDDYIELRKYVRNIIDWGAGGRLKGIQNSLDSLLENGRQRVSGVVKSRQPPSDGSETSGSKKRKISASHANSSRSSSVQEQDKGINAGDYITPQSQSRN